MNTDTGRKSGRKPPSRNDPRVQVLLAALEQGQFVSTSCDAAGIHRSTVARWVKRGEEAQISMEIDGVDIDASPKPSQSFKKRPKTERGRPQPGT